ncbi:hypothetical protein SPBR_07870 [Sporothrix brasiliensis 5110]|uniref:Uncharacterized protein n=1 Tax=Sporothrix brasiliensis 5110 TaxID=1398154 RepID=A0A0C2IRB6_9PEZI|nr:uncharacterized protein SPBR_07870 [Sporothrix brasiliensis 5110]KIH89430.1 hypothetical protein SPBR_07870 [Sporothrix brasiliensis 5110]
MGQTPLLSSLELYNELKRQLPEFIQALAEKKASAVCSWSTIECVIGRQYFPAKDDPEAKYIGWNWKNSYGFDIVDGDSLEEQHRKVEHRLPALHRVESTGLPSCFNGLMGVYGRARDNKAEAPYPGLDGKFRLPTTYGDGSPIPSDVLDKVLEIADSIGFWCRGKWVM